MGVVLQRRLELLEVVEQGQKCNTDEAEVPVDAVGEMVSVSMLCGM